MAQLKPDAAIEAENGSSADNSINSIFLAFICYTLSPVFN